MAARLDSAEDRTEANAAAKRAQQTVACLAVWFPHTRPCIATFPFLPGNLHACWPCFCVCCRVAVLSLHSSLPANPCLSRARACGLVVVIDRYHEPLKPLTLRLCNPADNTGCREPLQSTAYSAALDCLPFSTLAAARRTSPACPAHCGSSSR